MDPIAYSLCNSAVGVAMWITGLCSFPPLIKPIEVSLAAPGLILSQEFKAPVEKSYLLDSKFIFPTEETRGKDELVGKYFTKSCYGGTPYEDIPEKERQGLGVPLPFRVLVKDKSSGSLVFEENFNSLCSTGHDGKNGKNRSIGWIPLKEGTYRLEVYNLSVQPAFEGVKLVMSLVSGGRK